MEEVGFEEIGDYILNIQNMVAQYIATRPIMDLCEKKVRRPGDSIFRRLWEEEGIDLASVRVQAAAEADTEQEREGDKTER